MLSMWIGRRERLVVIVVVVVVVVEWARVKSLLGKFSVCKAVVDLNHNLIIFLHLKMEFHSSTSFLACSGNKWNAAYLLRNAMTTKQLKNLIRNPIILRWKAIFRPSLGKISKIRLFQNFRLFQISPPSFVKSAFVTRMQRLQYSRTWRTR